MKHWEVETHWGGWMCVILFLWTLPFVFDSDFFIHSSCLAVLCGTSEHLSILKKLFNFVKTLPDLSSHWAKLNRPEIRDQQMDKLVFIVFFFLQQVLKSRSPSEWSSEISQIQAHECIADWSLSIHHHVYALADLKYGIKNKRSKCLLFGAVCWTSEPKCFSSTLVTWTWLSENM